MVKASKELAHSLALAFPIRFWLPILVSCKHRSDLSAPVTKSPSRTRARPPAPLSPSSTWVIKTRRGGSSQALVARPSSSRITPASFCKQPLAGSGVVLALS